MDFDLKNAFVIKGFVMAIPGDYALTANQLSKNPCSWNGKEIFSGHRMPLFLKEWPKKFLGRVFNVEFKNNKLMGDLYLCPSKVDQIRPGLSNNLKNNQAQIRFKLHFRNQTNSILPLALLCPEIPVNEKAQNDCPSKILLEQEKRIVLYDHVLAKVGDENLSRLDLKKYPGAWNGRNIFYGLSGPPADARGWANRSIGRIFRTVFRNDELRCEVHLDPIGLQQIHIQLPDLIRSGAIKPRIKLFFGKGDGASTPTPFCLLMQPVELPKINKSNDDVPAVLLNPGKADPGRNERGVPQAPSILMQRTRWPRQRVNQFGVEEMPSILARKGR